MQDENKTTPDIASPSPPVVTNSIAAPPTTPLPPSAPAGEYLAMTPQPLSQSSSKPRFFDRTKLKTDNILELLFRFGFATVFLINSWTALAQPNSFLNLIQNNFAARIVGHYSVQVYAIAINDALLGILILLGVKKKYIYAWAGTWLMIVTFFKITSLI